MKFELRRASVLLPAVLFAISLTSCGDSATEAGLTDYEVVQSIAAAYLATNPSPVISPADVLEDVNGDQNFFILSVRSATHYDIGHVDGAINIPWRDVAESVNIAQLPSTDTDMVVYCYTGHTGGLAATSISLLGWNARNMKWGMMNWSSDPDIVGTAFWTTDDALEADVETIPNDITVTYDPPDLEVSPSSDEMTVVAAAIARWIADTNWTPIIAAQDVFDLITDEDANNDPVIVSVRSADHYAAGHIPGAINIPWKEIADLDNLAKLDPDADIVVYCYTGHTGGVATAILNTLGYKAKNMKFGMMAWNTTPAVLNTTPFSQTNDYPTVPTPGN